MERSRLDKMINHLLEKGCRWKSNDFLLFKSEIQQLHRACCDIFIKEPRLLQLKPPVKIAGNIHGQYNKIVSIFENGGLPPQSTYLFLGNYNGTPGFDLETILLLLALKMKYPDNIFLLRGNRDNLVSLDLLECIEINTFRLLFIYDCLYSLPVAALINDKIICTNGGLSPKVLTLDQKRHFNRGPHDKNLKLLDDLVKLFPISPGKGKEFLKKNDLRLIFSIDEDVGDYNKVLPPGAVYSKTPFFQDVGDYHKVLPPAEHRIVYISLAQCGEFDYPSKVGEVGAMMSIDEKLMYSFHILKPKGRDWLSYKFMAANNQLDVSPGVNHTLIKLVGESKSESPLRINPSRKTPATKYRSKSPRFKLDESTSKRNSGSSNVTTNSESSQPAASTTKSEGSSGIKPSGKTPATKHRSYSPDFKVVDSTSKPNSGNTSATTAFGFDPNSLYRSKSPGVKRFLGARV